MNFFVVTLFPEFIEKYFQFGVVGRGMAQGYFNVKAINLREFGVGKSREVDDYPFGGGGGMVLKPEPIVSAVESTGCAYSEKTKVIVTSAAGKLFTQRMAHELLKYENVIVVSGRYEGVDQRVVEILNADEISIGRFTLSSGDIPALAIIDATARLIEGVVGNYATVVDDSYESELVGFPHYTRPVEYRGFKVPEILRSGNHKLIEVWRKTKAILKTVEVNPEFKLNKEHLKILKESLKISDSFSDLEIKNIRELLKTHSQANIKTFKKER